jgi:ankyrin repeat protein
MSAMYNNSEDRTADIVKLILGRPGGFELVNKRDRQGNTALMIAARRKKLKAVKLLLSTPDIMVNVINKSHDTALSIAAACSLDMVKALIDAGAIVKRTAASNAIAHAIKARDAEMLEVLLASRSDWGGVKGDELALIRAAACEGGEEAVERIIAKVMEWGGGGEGGETAGAAGADAGVDAEEEESRKRKREADDVDGAGVDTNKR